MQDGFKPNVKCRNGKLDDNVWDALSLIIDTESEYHELCHIKHINPDGIIYHNYVHFSRLKPYLFPLSSMTDELWDKEFSGCGITEFTRDSFKYACETLEFNNSNPNLSSMVRFINQLIKNHFDIYGLIPKGLALDATKLNVY